jgi:hypothetical protein
LGGHNKVLTLEALNQLGQPMVAKPLVERPDPGKTNRRAGAKLHLVAQIGRDAAQPGCLPTRGLRLVHEHIADNEGDHEQQGTDRPRAEPFQ